MQLCDNASHMSYHSLHKSRQLPHQPQNPVNLPKSQIRIAHNYSPHKMPESLPFDLMYHSKDIRSSENRSGGCCLWIDFVIRGIAPKRCNRIANHALSNRAATLDPNNRICNRSPFWLWLYSPWKLIELISIGVLKNSHAAALNSCNSYNRCWENLTKVKLVADVSVSAMEDQTPIIVVIVRLHMLDMHGTDSLFPHPICRHH